MDGLRVAWRRVPPGTPRRDIAWSLLRELAGDVEIVNPCPFCGGAHGPVQLLGSPWLAGVSYAGDTAVAAVMDALGASAFAIDAEIAEIPGVRAWTRVEAALKADGRGMRGDPATVRIEGDADGWTATVPGPDGVDRVYRGLDVAAPDDLVVSAAARLRSTT